MKRSEKLLEAGKDLNHLQSIALKMITDWDEKSHPYQRLPEPIAEGHKNIWSLIFGRRAGKTKAASAAISEFAVTNDDAPIGVVAPTYRKLTEVNFQSEVGLLNHIPKELIVSSTISPPKIKLFNGAEIFGFTADVKDTLRGRGLKAVWEMSSLSGNTKRFGMKSRRFVQRVRIHSS